MTDRLRVIPAVVGVTLNLVWVAVLFAICATDGGHWRADRLQNCILWCSLMAVPAAIATAGIAKSSTSCLNAAAIACIPLTLISLAGAGVPMILPGILFYASSFAPKSLGQERRT